MPPGAENLDVIMVLVTDEVTTALIFPRTAAIGVIPPVMLESLPYHELALLVGCHALELKTMVLFWLAVLVLAVRLNVA